MSTMRAYKLAEELGIDRAEFVEKAAAIGVTLKSAMAAIDDELAQELREKLGTAKKDRGAVTESRVQRSSGGAVIRRRKKIEPELPPEPVAPDPVPESIVADAEAAPKIAEPQPEVVAMFLHFVLRFLYHSVDALEVLIHVLREEDH